MTVADLERRIESRDFTMTVVGIGRVGLPLAISFAMEGVRVFGVDRDLEHVQRVAAGDLPFVEHGAASQLMAVLGSGSFVPTGDAAGSLSESDVVVLTVGTPIGDGMQPDHSQIEAAAATLAANLRADTLVILRSTVAPGTTERVVVPAIEETTGLRLGKDLFVAFCPERIAEGRAIEELRQLPEIVGGVDEPSARLAGRVFQLLGPTKLIHLTDALSAELAKLFTNVYRYVNFALANEYGLIAEHYERDAHQIIKMLREDYPRAPIPLPGPAGGPCLSKDGYFLIQEISYPDFVLTAWKLNESIPVHVAQRLGRVMALGGRQLSGARVAVLGRAFKADIDDDRLSPSLRLIETLQRMGADVHVHDPYLPSESLEDALSEADAIVLATNHQVYGELDPKEVSKLVKPDCVVADCWAMLDAESWSLAGFEIFALGRG